MTIAGFTVWFSCSVRVFAPSIRLKNAYFSLHLLLNYFNKRQKQHQFFLIDFHLVKHTLTNVQQIGYMWTLKAWFGARLSFSQPHKHCHWGILSQVQHLSLIYVEQLTLMFFFSVPSASAKDIGNGPRGNWKENLNLLNVSAK